MPFDQFMAMALYDPTHGYYSNKIEDVGGRRGDFATSATLSKGLGNAITSWILAEKEYHDWETPIQVIEVGAGDGSLAAQIFRSLGWWKRRQLRYQIVEVSSPLRSLQEERLKSFPVSWSERVSDALEAAEGEALIFSNELVDAFPAKWLRWSEVDDCWLEVFVRFDREQGLSELFRPLPKGFPDYDYSALGMKNLSCGQRVEIQPLFQRWLGNTSEHLKRGSIFTIDYGGSPEEIYRRRPGGSLRGYFKQEIVQGAGIYQRFGKQDLTVDVNFEDLRVWGEGFGLKTVLEETQSEFLSRHGEGADPMATSAAGEAFRILHQRRD